LIRSPPGREGFCGLGLAKPWLIVRVCQGSIRLESGRAREREKERALKVWEMSRGRWERGGHVAKQRTMIQQFNYLGSLPASI
jgi:hypothetical protein